ncbi:hypothetical protein GFV12_05510 [Desulfurobacterium thermolithotrophum]|uniref:hypothetical protein n=1 Tax=Desulfurobacterium thermolithotrophum TaxID=64160 RepID=UPI0013D88E7A|nr:hypothetical protein [Desulfurobacterium thermolithotrophum]
MKLKKLVVGLFFITAFVYGYSEVGSISFHHQVEYHYSDHYALHISQKREEEKTEQVKICNQKESFKEQVEYSTRIDFRFVSSPPRASPTV